MVIWVSNKDNCISNPDINIYILNWDISIFLPTYLATSLSSLLFSIYLHVYLDNR